MMGRIDRINADYEAIVQRLAAAATLDQESDTLGMNGLATLRSLRSIPIRICRSPIRQAAAKRRSKFASRCSLVQPGHPPQVGQRHLRPDGCTCQPAPVSSGDHRRPTIQSHAISGAYPAFPTLSRLAVALTPVIVIKLHSCPDFGTTASLHTQPSLDAKCHLW